MAGSLATAVALSDECEIPLSIRSLAEFRDWALSEARPDRGRIDYLAGRIEVEMSPEDAWFHSVPKSALTATLHATLRARGLGTVFSDGMRYSHDEAGLSVEPDLMLILHETLRGGRATLIPKSGCQQNRYVEIQGAVDLVVEIVSDSSVKKDLHRLPPAYFAAGVAEFWLVDVRPGQFLFQIHHRGDTGWIATPPREDGSQRSTVLDRWYRLEQQELPGGIWTYDLVESE
jgi:Uma2 family endonuclease